MLPITPSGPGELCEASLPPAWPRLRWVRLWAGGPGAAPRSLATDPAPMAPVLREYTSRWGADAGLAPSRLTGSGAEPRQGLAGVDGGSLGRAERPSWGVYIALSSAPGVGGGGAVEGPAAAELAQTWAPSGCSPPLLLSGTHPCHPLCPESPGPYPPQCPTSRGLSWFPGGQLASGRKSKLPRGGFETWSL